MANANLPFVQFSVGSDSRDMPEVVEASGVGHVAHALEVLVLLKPVPFGLQRGAFRALLPMPGGRRRLGASLGDGG